MKTNEDVDIKKGVRDYLEGLGCKVYEGAPGIWYIKTSHGVMWDMTIPQPQAASSEGEEKNDAEAKWSVEPKGSIRFDVWRSAEIG